MQTEDRMKKTILIIILFLMLVSIVSSQLELTPEQKLKSYMDTTYKKALNYKNIAITDYKTEGNIAIVYLTIDKKDVRLFTSLNNFNVIIK